MIMKWWLWKSAYCVGHSVSSSYNSSSKHILWTLVFVFLYVSPGGWFFWVTGAFSSLIIPIFKAKTEKELFRLYYNMLYLYTVMVHDITLIELKNRSSWSIASWWQARTMYLVALLHTSSFAGDGAYRVYRMKWKWKESGRRNIDNNVTF